MTYQVQKYLLDRGFENIQANYQPDDKKTRSTVYSESAPQPDFVQGYNDDFVGLKFLTRSAVQQDAHKLAWDIHKEISALGDIELEAEGETIFVVNVGIQNSPTYLETDDKGRVVFVSHYLAHIETGGNVFRGDKMTYTPDMIADHFPYILDFELA